MQKLIRKHQWVTLPDSKGISYYGLTNFSKDFLLRLDSLYHEPYFKTNYGIMFSARNNSFISQTSQRYNIKPSQLYKNLQKITVAEQMQYDRFCIKQDQPFSILRTVQFDVELTAPIAMRILQCNFDVIYNCQAYRSQWLYKVNILDLEGLKQLDNQESYGKSRKIIPYEGMLL